MQDIIEQIASYLRGMWRQRWYALLVAWTFCIVGWAAVLQLPDQYEANARVHINTDTLLQRLVRDIDAGEDTSDRVRVITQTLLSRPNLEKIVRMTDMDIRLQDESAQESAMKSLEKKIKIARAGREDIFNISYSDADPLLSKKIVQAILTLFVENTLGESREETDAAQKFLDKQIGDYEQRLNEAENALKEFKRKNVGRMPEQGKDYYMRLQEGNNALREAELELRQAENQASELRRQVTGEEPTFGMVAPPVQVTSVPALDNRIQSMQEKLDELLLHYTEKHPDVVNTKGMIADLQKQKEETLKSMAGQGDGGMAAAGLDNNPVYQQLRISLGEADARVAALKVKVDEYKARAKELQGMVFVLPQVEAELAALNRDYEVNKQKYDQLTEKREATRISQEREVSSNDAQFRVVDPPRVPPEPTGPNRILFMSLVLVGSLGAGLFIALVLSQVLSTFDNPKDLMSALQLPVLGTVSYILSPPALRRRRLKNLAFAALCVFLLPVYGALIYLQHAGIPMLK
ncbi:MAG: chain length-determining protein [Gammaproteobacteria bacterium]|nr:chain length-determining protein [Gammaproteobacteria bacterium]